MAWRYRLAAAQTQHLLQKVLRKRTGFTRGCKMKRLFHLLPASFLILGLARFASAQSTPYPGEDLPKVYDRLLSKINAIPIYDNHAHPGFADDNDVDAMASPPDESSVLRLRDDNPEFVTASKFLFGYPYDDFKPEHAKWLSERKKAAEAAGGQAYFDSILDKLNVETCLANRAFMAPYLNPKRFHWVFFADSFFYPFDNHDQTASTPDMGVYIPLQEKMLVRYKKQMKVDSLPADLAGYEISSATPWPTIKNAAAWPSNLKPPISALSISATRRAKKPTPFTPSTTPPAFLPPKTIASFRTTFSA